MTNAEWIRSMSDEELAIWLHNICAFVSLDNEPYLSVLDSKVYTTDIVIEEQDFAESKAASQQNNSGNAQNASNNQQAQQPKPQTSPDGFMSADDGEELPFY